jgi:hypothetical protein
MVGVDATRGQWREPEAAGAAAETTHKQLKIFILLKHIF